jgi:hypothetical protein
MKKTIILCLSILFTICINAQKHTSNDTLTCKKVVPGRWAIEFDLGACSNQIFKPSYNINPIATTFNYKLFYRNFFLYVGTNISTFTPSKDLKFTNTIITNQNEISLSNMNMAIGYMYNFNKKWSADFKLGINSGNVDVLYNNQLKSYSPELVIGNTYGITINRFFKLKGYNYIVLSVGADYYTTDYSKISPDMNNQSVNYFLTIGYKGFNKKIMD